MDPFLSHSVDVIAIDEDPISIDACLRIANSLPGFFRGTLLTSPCPPDPTTPPPNASLSLTLPFRPRTPLLGAPNMPTPDPDPKAKPEPPELEPAPVGVPLRAESTDRLVGWCPPMIFGGVRPTVACVGVAAALLLTPKGRCSRNPPEDPGGAGAPEGVCGRDEGAAAGNRVGVVKSSAAATGAVVFPAGLAPAPDSGGNWKFMGEATFLERGWTDLGESSSTLDNAVDGRDGVSSPRCWRSCCCCCGISLADDEGVALPLAVTPSAEVADETEGDAELLDDEGRAKSATPFAFRISL